MRRRSSTTERFTYRDLIAKLEYWRRFLATAEVPAGEVVMLEGPASPDACAALLALIERRTIVVPLAPLPAAKRSEFHQLAHGQSRPTHQDRVRRLRAAGVDEVAAHPRLTACFRGVSAQASVGTQTGAPRWRPTRARHHVRMLSGPLAPLTAGTVATSWWLDPVGVVLAGLLGIGYVIGVRRVHARGVRWPLGRSLTFLLGGVGSLLLTTCSFLGAYAPQLRWVAVIQACLLLLVCPLLIGLGSPVGLLKAAGPRVASKAESRVASRASAIVRGVWSVLVKPGVAPLVLLVVISLLVFTPWLGWAQEGTPARAVTVLALLGAGLLLALPVTDHGAEISSLAYAAMLGLGVIEFLLDAVPGMVLRLDSHLVVADHWTAIGRTWGPSPLDDQRLAGDWLWFFAEVGDLPFLLILIVAWIRSDAREAAAQDAALDLLELQDPEAGGLMRPWWLTEDPRQ